MNKLICLSWRFPIRKRYQPIWGLSEHRPPPRFPPRPTPHSPQWVYKRENRPGHSRFPSAREDHLSSQKLKMWRSLCLQLLLIFLPFGLPRSVPVTVPGAQAQGCCRYWSTISEICSKLNVHSVSSWRHPGCGQARPGSLRPEALMVLSLFALQTPEDMNLRLELQVRAQAQGPAVSLPWAGACLGQAHLDGHNWASLFYLAS